MGLTAVILQVKDAPALALQILANVALVFTSAAASFAVLATFLRFPAPYSSILGQLSENAYGIYLIHYPYAILLQYLLLNIALPAILKGAIVFVLNVLLSWATVAAILRNPIASRWRRRRPDTLARASQPAKRRL